MSSVGPINVDSVHLESAQDHAPSAESIRMFSGPKDALLLAGEWLARQIYWRNERLRNWVSQGRKRQTPTPQIADRQELIDYLTAVGVRPGSLVMAHTSVSGVSFTKPGSTEIPQKNALQISAELLSILLERVGDNGTLVMPTNPDYKAADRSRRASDDLSNRASSRIVESAQQVLISDVKSKSRYPDEGPSGLQKSKSRCPNEGPSRQGRLRKMAPNCDSALSESLQVYNPRATPCGIGLVNELFWRKSGTLRSLCPHNPLAARGPLASELLHDNLNESKPLPHGINSGYFRFTQKNGLLISIGIPLAKYLTLAHVAEEIRDRDWPVPNFFEERTYVLRDQGADRIVTIRQTRPEFMKFGLCNQKLQRDLRRAGIVHEGRVGTLRVDWAHSADVIRFLLERNQSTTYPYYFTSLIPRETRRAA